MGGRGSVCLDGFVEWFTFCSLAKCEAVVRAHRLKSVLLHILAHYSRAG